LVPVRDATLGSYRLTRIGLGTNRLRNTPENRAFLERALDAGINLIDTAHLYAGGESERAIGDALSTRADGLVVATKGGYQPGTGRPDVLRAELEESFRRLRTQRIRLYYLHRVDPETPLEDSLAVLREYHDAGRIEHVGLSQVGVEELERAREIVPVAAIQNEYNVGRGKYDSVIDYCETNGILFLPFHPLKGERPPGVAEIAAHHGAGEHQVVLAWLLRRSPVVVPIPGTLSIEHLRENLGALEIELSDDEYESIAAG
jgi:pyridoxine 4-dehydrogenase